MTEQNNHVVIMAGGVGSRFWPMSTPDYPKQFLDVMGCGRTLLQLTADRCQGLCPMENMWVVTSKQWYDTVCQQLPEVNPSHILQEPCRRGTAPCIAYVSWKIRQAYPKANLVITPSDHTVIDITEFRRVVQSALLFTANSDAIVTLGMRPSRPETGYGYIEADLAQPSLLNKEIFHVENFHEKPDLETAKQYIMQKHFLWNAGIFVWNVNTIIQSIRIFQPNIAHIFDQLVPYYNTPQEQEAVDRLFPLCEQISIDYAVMEKADEIFVFPASFGWSDLGTWGSLHHNMPKDVQGNAIIGDHIHLHECRNCIVHAEGKKKVVLQGLEGFIVAEHDDTLLVCRMAEDQRIREYAEE